MKKATKHPESYADQFMLALYNTITITSAVDAAERGLLTNLKRDLNCEIICDSQPADGTIIYIPRTTLVRWLKTEVGALYANNALDYLANVTQKFADSKECCHHIITRYSSIAPAVAGYYVLLCDRALSNDRVVIDLINYTDVAVDAIINDYRHKQNIGGISTSKQRALTIARLMLYSMRYSRELYVYPIALVSQPDTDADTNAPVGDKVQFGWAHHSYLFTVSFFRPGGDVSLSSYYVGVGAAMEHEVAARDIDSTVEVPDVSLTGVSFPDTGRMQTNKPTVQSFPASGEAKRVIDAVSLRQIRDSMAEEESDEEEEAAQPAPAYTVTSVRDDLQARMVALVKEIRALSSDLSLLGADSRAATLHRASNTICEAYYEQPL
jgi:hypothetical protein